MDLSECGDCGKKGACAATRVFETIWGDAGVRVTDKDVAAALSEANVARAGDCAALKQVEGHQTGVTARVQAFMSKVDA